MRNLNFHIGDIDENASEANVLARAAVRTCPDIRWLGTFTSDWSSGKKRSPGTGLLASPNFAPRDVIFLVPPRRLVCILLKCQPYCFTSVCWWCFQSRTCQPASITSGGSAKPVCEEAPLHGRPHSWLLRIKDIKGAVRVSCLSAASPPEEACAGHDGRPVDRVANGPADCISIHMYTSSHIISVIELTDTAVSHHATCHCLAWCSLAVALARAAAAAELAGQARRGPAVHPPPAPLRAYRLISAGGRAAELLDAADVVLVCFVLPSLYATYTPWWPLHHTRFFLIFGYAAGSACPCDPLRLQPPVSPLLLSHSMPQHRVR